jgi:aryl-alcohol dehydrogenase-like predicted oxidoreductase
MNPLGRTGLSVSAYCLGTMTFGTQTSEADGHDQINRALDHGINVLDTAEMYPTTPMSATHWGDTERIVGTWNAKHPSQRGDYILATKVSGAGQKIVRDGVPITRATILEAVDGSLKRLQTDYIDLYQLHWPNRGSYHFRKNWTYDPSGQSKTDTLAHVEEVLQTAQELIDAGKIRHVGLSNETAWGAAQWLRIAEEKGLPRMEAIQNEYSLLCRTYDLDLAELSINEDVGLLAFSPLACGYLTGKYLEGASPEGSRKSINPRMGGRVGPRIDDAVQSYLDIADRHGLDPVHMSLAFCASRPFMSSVIFGARTSGQLDRILTGLDVTLSDEVLEEITASQKAHPMPY